MRNLGAARPRGSTLHCMICCVEMPVSTLRKTCGPECRKIFKRLRRAVQSVRCWVSLVSEPGKRLLLWLPRKAVMRPDTGVSRGFRARTAISRDETSRKAKRSPNG